MGPDDRSPAASREGKPADGVAYSWTWPGPNSAPARSSRVPPSIKVKPTRDAFGRVTGPARVWLSAQESPRKPPTPADAALEFPRAFLKTTGRRRPPDLSSTPDSPNACSPSSPRALTAVGPSRRAPATSRRTSELQAKRHGVGILGEACVGGFPHVETPFPWQRAI